jgi:flagellar biosynthesis protein FlhB
MRYVRSEGGAPVVLAKGIDLIALKIRAIAEAHEIPVIEDKPLARSLYSAVEVERPIPTEFYRAVAEIVHLIQQRKAAWPRRAQCRPGLGALDGRSNGNKSLRTRWWMSQANCV